MCKEKNRAISEKIATEFKLIEEMSDDARSEYARTLLQRATTGLRNPRQFFGWKLSQQEIEGYERINDEIRQIGGAEIIIEHD